MLTCAFGDLASKLHGRVDRESRSKFKDFRSLTLKNMNGQNWISKSTIRNHVIYMYCIYIYGTLCIYIYIERDIFLYWDLLWGLRHLICFLKKPQLCGFEWFDSSPKVKLMCPSSVFKDLFAVQLARWDPGAPRKWGMIHRHLRESGGRNFLGKVMFLPIFELLSPKTMFFLFCLALKWCVFLSHFYSSVCWNEMKWHHSPGG